LSEKRRGLALLEGVLAGTFFGTAAVFIRLLQDVDVFSIAFWRLAVACVVLAVIIVSFKRTPSIRVLRQRFVQVAFLGVMLGLHFILFVSAVKDTTILNATVLVNTTPIWALIVSVVLLRVKPTRLATLGVVISFAGVGTIAFADASSPAFSFNLRGDLEAVLAAVVEAFYLGFGRNTRQKVPIFTLMLVVYMVSALTVLAASTTAVPSSTAFTVDLQTILLLVGLGILSTALAHTLYFSSLSSLKSFETATLALLEPIVATCLGALIFAEIPSELFVLGALLVVGGMLSVLIQK
jgi:drug/metabolite transporter (DMT)-like permease